MDAKSAGAAKRRNRAATHIYMNTFGTLAANKGVSTAGTAKEELPRFLARISSHNMKPDVIKKIDDLGLLEPSYSFRNDDDGKKRAVGSYWKRVEQVFSAKEEEKEPQPKDATPPGNTSKKTKKSNRPIVQEEDELSSVHDDSGDEL